MAKQVPAQYSNVFDSASLEMFTDVAQVSDEIKDAARQIKVTDANDTLVFARQLETIKNRLYEIKYAELKGRSFVPVSYSAGPNAEFLTYRVWDGTTMARLITNYATDFEMVTASAKELFLKFYDIGNAYGYSIRDLQKAAAANVPLDMQYAKLARRGIELGIDDAIAVGIPQVRTFGLTNHPNVTLVSATNGGWATATGQQMLDDLNQLVTYMFQGTLEILSVNTVLMSTKAYRKISTTLVNSANASNITVLEAFQKQNPGINVESWTKLNLANAAGTAGRIVAYNKSDEVLEFEMAVDFEVFPEERQGLQLKHACLARVGGLALHQPMGVIYNDNCDNL